MNNLALKAQLDLRYKRFQWYADILDNAALNGADDLFIQAYDAKDVRGCNKALSLMSDALNSDAGNKQYKTWRISNE